MKLAARAFFVAKLGDVRRELKVPLAEALLKDKDPKVQAQALAFVRDRELKVAPAMPKALLKCWPRRSIPSL